MSVIENFVTENFEITREVLKGSTGTGTNVYVGGMHVGSYMTPHGEYKKSVELKAALISAAPDMLYALELATEALNCDNSETVEYADKKVRAAINKAKGE